MSSCSNNVVTVQRVGDGKFVVTPLGCKTPSNQVTVIKSTDMLCGSVLLVPFDRTLCLNKLYYGQTPVQFQKDTMMVMEDRRYNSIVF